MRAMQRADMGDNLTPAWPPYVATPVERTLAVMIADGRLLTEHGEYLEPHTYQQLVDLCFTHNLQTYIGAVGSALQDWEEEYTKDMDQEAGKLRGQWTELEWSENREELAAVHIHRKWPDKNGRRICWQKRNLTVSSCWSRVIEPELLQDLRYLFQLLETGVCATPGATGKMTITRYWRGTTWAQMRRHYRPPLLLVDALEEHAIGSRREAYRPLDIFDESYELDASNGYCAQAGQLPCGPIHHWNNGQTELWTEPRADIVTWWGDCWVRIWNDGLAPGDVAPFSIRDDQGTLHWPTAAGLYHTYLWKFEADEIWRRSQAGEPISCYGVGEAWGWTDWTYQLREWQQYMDKKRREARYGVGGSKAREALVKAVIVSGIGGLGIPYSHDRITTLEEDGAQLLQGAGLPDAPLYRVHEFSDPGTPKHWHSYILSQMNYRIYQELRRCYLDDIPVAACNVDGLITLRRPYWGAHPDYVRLGEFKVRRLGSWVSCPRAGVILDPENNDYRIPGMSQEERRRVIGLYRIGEKPIKRRGEKPNAKMEARASFRGAMAIRAHILHEDGLLSIGY